MTLLSLFPESFKEKLRERAGAITTPARLRNLRVAGFAPAQIIDAGAYHGDWARMAHEVFPAASILMIEPQPLLAPRLAQLCQDLPGLRLRSALLGEKPGRAKFLAAESNSRITAEAGLSPADPRVHDLAVETLAAIAAAEGFEGCSLLKLDLQGHELMALAGAGPLFGRVEVIIIEASLLPIGDVPLFREVADAFQQRGYRLYDIFGCNHRPLDGALWQVDLVFVRDNSPLLAQAGRYS